MNNSEIIAKQLAHVHDNEYQVVIFTTWEQLMYPQA